MNVLRSSLALGVLLCAALASSALAEGVRIVTPTGNLNFSDIQPAVDAASDGDVLLIAEGSYGGFTIDGKSLSIYAAPSANAIVEDTVRIRNLRPPQSVVLSGIQVAIPAGQDYLPALILQDNSGLVRAQDCQFLADQVTSIVSCDDQAACAVLVRDCARVLFVASTLRGAHGDTDYLCLCSNAQSGGHGLDLSDSSVALYDCSVFGGHGGNVDPYCYGSPIGPGAGGSGIHAGGGVNEVFASGSQSAGGGGGHTKYGQGSGGDGLFLSPLTVAYLVDCSLAGGMQGGKKVAGSGTLIRLPGDARSVQATAVTVSRRPLEVAYLGHVDDILWLPISTQPGHTMVPSACGVCLTEFPPPMPATFAGVVPASGVLNLQLQLLDLPPAASHASMVYQGLIDIEDGRRVFSSGRHVLALSPTVGPDCNGNGFSDYVDVILGSSPDANHNLIPDECPGG